MSNTRTAKAAPLELTPAPEVAPPAPSPASAFRRAGIYQLPSCGLFVELRWPGLYALVLTGEIPNPLTADVLRMVSGAANDKDPEDEEALIERYRKDARSFLGIAQRCLVRPRLVLDREPDYERDEIGPGDLHEQDMLWIYGHFVQKGPAAETVALFRRA